MDSKIEFKLTPNDDPFDVDDQYEVYYDGEQKPLLIQVYPNGTHALWHVLDNGNLELIQVHPVLETAMLDAQEHVAPMFGHKPYNLCFCTECLG